MDTNQTNRSHCGISCALDALGDKWSLLIVRDIVLLHKKTFKEFVASSERIATNILADRLKKLETHGLITK
jgi:DNA-binding HxlR family transcriptional regulator